ncbi:LLM class flavin-dependent oxidoreductase [Pseudomonas bohemica]|uniref:LLM class flavin-dependent oxidoreductase n=1 Tax=Pseudomonas bohemica TaxID=2044872 RepID=UPI000DA62A97|nr:LLM class flavin-dependent oxidoreductase [Pseudomonas bohemica]
MTNHTPLNILDLVHVTEGGTVDDALSSSMAIAQLADRLGYSRIWYAEHHNTAYLGASSPAMLISRAASLTQRIRVGSGGVMLPNHAPLQVAEEFGTLAHFSPGRIDLGLGRAPGTDALTAQVLSRSGADPQSFARNVYDLTGWFSDTGLAHSDPIVSGVSIGTHVPLWILGSSISGASIAGRLGLPFCIASHFAPDEVDRVLEIYRSSFDPRAPTAQISKPYVMAGINVMVAPTDEEAMRLWTTSQRMILDVRTGNRQKLQPPVAPDAMGTTEQRAFAESFLHIKAVGSPATACQALERFTERTQADELIIMTYAHDPADKLRSMELLAELWF